MTVELDVLVIVLAAFAIFGVYVAGILIQAVIWLGSWK